jgi:hypothetical protein
MKIFAITALAAVLTGCATSSNEAYVAAHRSANESRVSEAAAKTMLDTQRAKAIAQMAAACTDAGCLGMALMAMGQVGQTYGAPATAPAPVIAAPVNEITEFVKTVGNIVVPVYSLWSGAVSGIVNATRGSADAGTARLGLSVMTPKLGSE